MKKKHIFFASALMLLSGCMPEGSNMAEQKLETSTPSDISTMSCYDAVISMLEQDGFTRTGNTMEWTRGGSENKPQVVIDFENALVYLNNPEFSYNGFEYMKKEDFETEEDYSDYIKNAYVMYRYDAKEDRFIDLSDGSSSLPRDEIENELRGMYEKYVSDTTFFGCGSLHQLPWRRFEKMKAELSSVSPDFFINSQAPEQEAKKEPIDLDPRFIEVSTLDEFMEYAQSKYIPAYENIGKPTQMNSFRKVGVDLLILDAENVNGSALSEDATVSPAMVLEYIQNHYFDRSEYAGDYLVFLRLKDEDIEKIKEEMQGFEVNDTMTLFHIPSDKDGNLSISQSLTDSSSIIEFLNDSLGIDAMPSYELYSHDIRESDEWRKLFGIYEK